MTRRYPPRLVELGDPERALWLALNFDSRQAWPSQHAVPMAAVRAYVNALEARGIVLAKLEAGA